jgi:hypothetical protein
MGRPKWEARQPSSILNSRSLRWHKDGTSLSLASDPTRFAKFSSFHSPAKGCRRKGLPIEHRSRPGRNEAGTSSFIRAHHESLRPIHELAPTPP